MLNGIFIFLIVASVLTGAFSGQMNAVTQAGINSAKTAVDLALSLIGQMALWLGFMAVLREAGLMASVARALTPIMRKLFPGVPADHPAMGSMILNLAANILGIGNAATPFGLKAMHELNQLNRHPGVATNAMAMFLAINTSGVAVLPLGAIAVRAAVGSKDPAGIIVPSLIATMVSTVSAILVTRLLENRATYAPEKFAEPATQSAPFEKPGIEGIKGISDAEKAAQEVAPAKGPLLWINLALTAAVLYAIVRFFQYAPPEQTTFDTTRVFFSDWLLPLLMLAIVAFGMGRRVKVYEALVTGAKEGFQIAVMIIPFLVAIIVGIGMFRASGAMDVLVRALSPILSPLGFPPEALPMALIRPLSGSGALAVMTETMKTHVPDSFVGYLVSVINGSTETTFYVLAVYFGSVTVRATRHTVYACLAADVVGISAACAICHVFF
jgi:spore maturation protein SpmA